MIAASATSLLGLSQHQRGALARRDELIMLVIRAMFEYHDAIVRPRTAGANFTHLGFYVHRIPMEKRLGEPHRVPSEIGHRRAQGRIADRNPDHQTQSERAVDDSLTELGLRSAILIIEV